MWIQYIEHSLEALKTLPRHIHIQKKDNKLMLSLWTYTV